MVGLHAVGKTTILYKLKLGEIVLDKNFDIENLKPHIGPEPTTDRFVVVMVTQFTLTFLCYL